MHSYTAELKTVSVCGSKRASNIIFKKSSLCVVLIKPNQIHFPEFQSLQIWNINIFLKRFGDFKIITRMFCKSFNLEMNDWNPC